MATVNVYLNFNGNCEEAFDFYRSIFGGDYAFIGKFKDAPQGEGAAPMSAEDGEKIMHVMLPISKETSIMGSDSIGEWSPMFKEGNNYCISINAESRDEADRLFNGLSAGGNIGMPMNDTFWGAYFGMFTDKFGVHWMVNFDVRPMD